MFNSCSAGVPAETRKLSEDLLYSLSNKRLSHSAALSQLSTVVEVPSLVREYSECYQNSQLFAVTGISSTYYGRIQNFRLCTLGVPVRNSDSREDLRNSLTTRSSKLELRFFFTVTFAYDKYRLTLGVPM